LAPIVRWEHGFSGPNGRLHFACFPRSPHPRLPVPPEADGPAGGPAAGTAAMRRIRQSDVLLLGLSGPGPRSLPPSLPSPSPLARRFRGVGFCTPPRFALGFMGNEVAVLVTATAYSSCSHIKPHLLPSDPSRVHDRLQGNDVRGSGGPSPARGGGGQGPRALGCALPHRVGRRRGPGHLGGRGHRLPPHPRGVPPHPEPGPTD